jgi:hypothetical protein
MKYTAVHEHFSFTSDICFYSLALNHAGVTICAMKETEHKQLSGTTCSTQIGVRIALYND